jgi:hypothetical protein
MVLLSSFFYVDLQDLLFETRRYGEGGEVNFSQLLAYYHKCYTAQKIMHTKNVSL